MSDAFSGGTAEERREVVGAAIVHRGRVLTARRAVPPVGTRPGQRWEFPGGKVEPGESRDAALVREIAEELGCTIEVTGWFEEYADVGRTHRLFVAQARLVEGEPVPREGEHDAVRWLRVDEVDAMDWLGPDRPFLEHLKAALRAAADG